MHANNVDHTMTSGTPAYAVSVASPTFNQSSMVVLDVRLHALTNIQAIPTTQQDHACVANPTHDNVPQARAPGKPPHEYGNHGYDKHHHHISEKMND